MSDMNVHAAKWLEAELEDNLDEAYELELGEAALAAELDKIQTQERPASLDRRVYFTELLRLQSELIKPHSSAICTSSPTSSRPGAAFMTCSINSPRVLRP